MNTDVNRVINLLRRCRVPVVVANTDLLYPVAANEVALATGSIAKTGGVRAGAPLREIRQAHLPNVPDGARQRGGAAAGGEPG